jgi:putative nucleotidyltransferase with HDIG domain
MPEWRARRKLAWSIRAATVAVPFAAATSCMVLLSRVLPRPAATIGQVAWFGLLLCVSWLVARLVSKCVDRSLPLAALLEMSLTFPESAPSRLGLAQRGSSRSALAQLAVAPPDETAQAAAERILRLLTALSAHDRFTRGHAERVRAYADLIAERLDMTATDRDRLRWAALLHDIGKLQVPSKLLGKPGKPTPAEWDVLRQHPAAGAVIAAPLLAWLSPMERVIAEHHERWDGTGYPAGLRGEDISFGARVVCVADCFEAMTAARPYSRPIRREAALRELVNCAGTHFDPDVVRALLTVPRRRLSVAMGPAAWLAGLPLAGQSSMTVVRAAAHAGTMTAGATAVVVAAVGPTTVLGAGPAFAEAASASAAAPATATATAPKAPRTTGPRATPAPRPTASPSDHAPRLPAPTTSAAAAVTPVSSPTSTKVPSRAPTASPSRRATPPPPLPPLPPVQKTAAPTPKPTPAAKPTAKPSAKPTKTPKAARTPKPTQKPTGKPQPTPTPKPTKTVKPVKSPNLPNAPTASATSRPTGKP